MHQPLPFVVYVLRSLTDCGLYIGFTTDLGRRLAEHNAGESPATAPRRPFALLYCECFLSKDDAQRREVYLKTSAGRRTLKLMCRAALAAAQGLPRLP